MKEKRNAFEILAEYNSRAKRAGVSKEQRNFIFELAIKGDYEHLVKTIRDATKTIC